MVWSENDRLEQRDIELLRTLGIGVEQCTASQWRKAAKQAAKDAEAAAHDSLVYMWLKHRQHALERACWVAKKQGRY